MTSHKLYLVLARVGTSSRMTLESAKSGRLSSNQTPLPLGLAIFLRPTIHVARAPFSTPRAWFVWWCRLLTAFFTNVVHRQMELICFDKSRRILTWVHLLHFVLKDSSLKLRVSSCIDIFGVLRAETAKRHEATVWSRRWLELFDCVFSRRRHSLPLKITLAFISAHNSGEISLISFFLRVHVVEYLGILMTSIWASLGITWLRSHISFTTTSQSTSLSLLAATMLSTVGPMTALLERRLMSLESDRHLLLDHGEAFVLGQLLQLLRNPVRCNFRWFTVFISLFSQLVAIQFSLYIILVLGKGTRADLNRRSGRNGSWSTISLGIITPEASNVEHQRRIYHGTVLASNVATAPGRHQLAWDSMVL